MRGVTGVALIAALGCGGGGQSQETHTAKARATVGAAVDAGAAAEPGPFAALNLGFEEVDGEVPRGWRVGAKGYAYAADTVARGGARSLRLAATEGGTFGSAGVKVDATPVRGKRLVLRGWIKTEGVDGWAGLWLRADPDGMAFDNMQTRGIKGDQDWTEGQVTIDVPVEATTIVFGPLLAGAGRAWFDDLRVEVVDLQVGKPLEISGRVEDAAGQPVAGAIVGLVAPLDPRVTVSTVSGVDGRWRLAATTGRWAVSAHHPSGVGAFTEARELVPPGADDVVVRLGAPGSGVTVRGRLDVEGGVPAGATLTIAPESQHETDAFFVPVAPDGTFAAVLPRGPRYHVRHGGALSAGADTLPTRDDVAEGTLQASVVAPPPDAVVAWLRSAAIPLASAEAGHGFADLAPLARAVGKARIVALGEATHGTREFFQLKHRLLEYLVAELGFTVFAIEANQPECRAINAYVVDGKGDARAALAGIYFWTWNTEEVLAMIEWMRAWNADPAHRRKVKFVGFDMQTPTVARENVKAYLARVAPGRADPSPMTREVVAALAKEMDAKARAWSRATGRAAFDEARQDLRVLEQHAALEAAEAARRYEVRDRAMADNVAWILAHEPPGTRMVLWAHNGHVTPGREELRTMGRHLRARFGADYLVAGFVFSHGAFQAIDRRRGGLREVRLPPPAEDNVATAFTRTGHERLIVDLRRIPDEAVARWFARPRPMRETGAVFFTDEGMTYGAVLPRLFDWVIFVRETTRARPVSGG